MKTINKIFSLLLLFTVAVISGCSRDYDAPPLNEPLYEGDEANITINELKEKYKEVLQGDAKQIDFDFILKARIISSDDEGNVYKQMYVQDATSGLNIQIDQSNISKVYPLGQEVYLQIKGLYMGSYNGVMQLAAAPLDPEKPNNTSRISFEKFKTLAFKDKWPAPDKVIPTVTSISDLKDEMVCTLITLKDVSFVGGGELSYAEVGNDAPNASDRTLKDKKGSSITVRTSKYATFAADVLPSGTGEVTAILGKFRDTWQLTINSVKDVKSFEGEEPGNPDPIEPEQPTGDFYYKETFGTKEYANKERPFIKDFKDSDNEGKVVLSDQYGTVNIRTYEKNSHAFFGGNKNGELAISKIDLSKGQGKKLALSYKMAASLFLSKEDKDKGKDLIANLNAITVSCNGKELPVPSKEVSFKNGDDNKFYTIEIDAEIPAEKDVTLVFTSLAEKNKTGFRIDDITISEKK